MYFDDKLFSVNGKYYDHYIACRGKDMCESFLKDLENMGYCWREGQKPTQMTYFERNFNGIMVYYLYSDGKVLEFNSSAWNILRLHNFVWYDDLGNSASKNIFCANGYHYIVCESEEEANNFLRILEENGYRWSTGIKPTRENYWENNDNGVLMYCIHNGSKEITYFDDSLSYIGNEERKWIFFKNISFVDREDIPNVVDDDEEYLGCQDNKDEDTLDEAFGEEDEERVVPVGHKQEESCLDRTSQDKSCADKTSKKEKEIKSMNLFGMNLECGLCEDNKISSTIMGVAVKNGDSWRIFDKDKKVMTDVGDLSLGDFPVYIIPSKTVAVGDLIKKEKHYYYVTEVHEDGSIGTINASTGNVVDMVPVQSVLGFRFYNKVIAFGDGLLDGETDDNKLFLAMALSGGKGDMNSLLPLLLLKKDGTDNDDGMLRKVALLSMMQHGTGSGDSNSLFLLLLLKGDLF